jgi:phosphatidylglycerophosphatase A
MNSPLKRIKLNNPWHLLATGFGSGLAPIIPGTMGTLASVPFYWLLVQLPTTVYFGMVILAAIIGVKICQVTSDDMQVHDHGSIVWDEFVGFWITMSVVPWFGVAFDDWRFILTGFVLFRFFDMVKPWPIGWLDRRVEGGVGIMVDDIVAGGMAAAALGLIATYNHWL